MENGEIKNQKTTLTLRMGSNDCAEICEITRIYILLQSSNLMSREDSGLYRDGGPTLLQNTNGKLMDS